MNNELVTVLMPAYNAGKYIRLAIESILRQTYTNFELLIINDGSTDNTESIILSFCDSRIRYVKNSENLKLIATLNKGVDLAKGEYIARMDADDIALPDMISNAIRGFREAPYASVVNQYDYEMNDAGSLYWKRYFFRQLPSEALKYTQIFTTQILHPGIVIRTSVLKKYRYSTKPEALHREDFDLWIRLLTAGHYVHVISSYAVYHRRAVGSITNTRHEKNTVVKDMMKRYLELYNAHLSEKTLKYIIYGDISDVFTITNSYNEILHFFKELKSQYIIRDEIYLDLKEWLYLFHFSKGLQAFKKGIKEILAFIMFGLRHPLWCKYGNVTNSLSRMITRYDRKKLTEI